MSSNLTPTEIVRLYKIWTSILSRCTNKEHKQYKNYGGRGIGISKEWLDFNQFCKDLPPRPYEEYELDREDNNKGYCKNNCRWVSRITNQRNRRNNRIYETHLGNMCQSQLIEHIGFTRSQFKRALEKYGETEFLVMFKENRLPKKRITANLLEFEGKKLGKLTINKLDSNKSSGIFYFCTCDCGKETRVSRYKLIHGIISHCLSCAKRGDKNPNSTINRFKLKKSGVGPFISYESYVNTYHSSWYVLQLLDNEYKKPRTFLCRCKCGVEKKVNARNLINGKSSMCHSCSAKAQWNKKKNILV